MKTFKYSACDTAGSRKEGLTQANSPNDVIGWLRECTVRIMNSVDDLIVLCSYESNAAIPVHVGKCCVGCIKIRGIILSIWSAGVDRIAAFKKHRGDQRLGSFVVLHNCNIGGVASI